MTAKARIGGRFGVSRSWRLRQTGLLAADGFLNLQGLWVSPTQPEVDLALDVAPFLSRAQHPDQLVERARISGGELEPRDEIKWLTEIPPVMETSCNSRQVRQRAGDMVRALLEDRASLLLRQLPPLRALADWDHRRGRRLRPSQRRPV